jgi:hypothetical protein
MFITQEAQLSIAYPAARSRLASLVLTRNLGGASHTAYQAGLKPLMRVGPFGDMPGAAKLVRVSFLEPVERDDSFRVGLRWEATGVTAGLFPVLDGDFTITPTSNDGTRLALTGVYRPPFGLLGAALDAAVLRKVAEATFRSLVRSVADAIIEPAIGAGPWLLNPGTQPRAANEELC